MEYQSETPNAIILPLPVKLPSTEQDIRFIDLSENDDFFEELATAFPYIHRLSIGCSSGPATTDAAAELTVHSVGSFIASFVPRVSDFDRLDPQFAIPSETWGKITEYADYGFVVFQLAELSGKPHPMAFEFPSRTKDVFFPTVHIHDGEVHEREQFAHDLFMQHAGLDSEAGNYINCDVADANTGLIRSVDVAGQYCKSELTSDIIAPDLLLHRTSIIGEHANEDLFFKVKGDALVVTGRLLRTIRNWSWLIPIAAIGWFLQRRSRLRRKVDPHDLV